MARRHGASDESIRFLCSQAAFSSLCKRHLVAALVKMNGYASVQPRFQIGFIPIFMTAVVSST